MVVLSSAVAGKHQESTLHIHQRPSFVERHARGRHCRPGGDCRDRGPAALPGAANTASVPQTTAGCAADVRRRGSTAGLLHVCARHWGRNLPPCMRSCLCPFSPGASRQPAGGGLNVARTAGCNQRETRGRHSCGIARYHRCCAAACCLVPDDVNGGLAALAPILHSIKS
jgi:hypothetical protein